MKLTEADLKVFKTTKMLWYALVVACPLVFLFIANRIPPRSPEQAALPDFAPYILLLLAFTSPLVLLLARRLFQNAILEKRKPRQSNAQLFQTLVFMRGAMTEASFVYGLVVYLLMGDMTKMLWFYPIGIIWSIVFWPTQAKLEQFIEEANCP